jgi:hypothetical protein
VRRARRGETEIGARNEEGGKGDSKKGARIRRRRMKEGNKKLKNR